MTQKQIFRFVAEHDRYDGGSATLTGISSWPMDEQTAFAMARMFAKLEGERVRVHSSDGCKIYTAQPQD